MINLFFLLLNLYFGYTNFVQKRYGWAALSFILAAYSGGLIGCGPIPHKFSVGDRVTTPCIGVVKAIDNQFGYVLYDIECPDRRILVPEYKVIR